MNYQYATKDNVVELLKFHKLTTNHVVNKAGDRGVVVHNALESWAQDRVLPTVEIYPEDQRGYILGLRSFLTDLKVSPRAKIDTEVMVGSVKHGFAGRYDMALAIQDSDLVVKNTPVRGETRETFRRGRWLFDLKTSSGVYPTHHLQLEAYEGASVECGYKPTIGRAIVRVDKDGWYEVRKSVATFGDFLKVKAVYDVLQEMKGKK